MSNRPRRNEPPQILSGWKDIANYLGRGVRTVQRYERQLGLPVRRPAGKPSGSVVATKAELDAWVNASPIREVFRLAGHDVESDYAVLAERMKSGLQQMMRLKEQMLALRQEVKESVKVLRESVHGLQGGLNPGRWSELDEAYARSANGYVEPRTPDRLKELAPSKYPKAI